MNRYFKPLTAFALILTFAMAFPVMAQQAAPGQPPVGGTGAPPARHKSNGNEQERNALRQQIEQIRAEHQQMETERDRLRDQIEKVGAKEQELHQRMEALRSQLEALRG